MRCIKERGLSDVKITMAVLVTNPPIENRQDLPGSELVLKQRSLATLRIPETQEDTLER